MATMGGANPWTPHRYPLQSPPPQGGGLPSPDETTKEVPRLPRTIRAFKEEPTEIVGRTIIICLDGTGDKFDSDNSNIVHLVSCLKKSDPSQVTYYQSGIGTYDGKGVSNGINAGFDMAIGSGLGVHVRDAYMFLMQTFHENDRICLFGFSRGAYTARCLAGMIHKVGLLPAHNRSQVEFAYQYYKDDTPEGWKMSAEFKRAFCMNVSVHFIGVFDCVASVGFIPRKLPLSSTPTTKASFFRHAMALDEHRSKFKVCRFQRKDHVLGADAKWETAAEIQVQADGQVRGVKSDSHMNGSLLEKRPRENSNLEDDPTLLQLERLTADEPRETDVLEVWFSGCHADVGGGAVKNEERHKLSQIPLRWMIRQCFECDTGIIFKTHPLAEEGLDVHTLWPVYTPLTRPLFGPPPSLMDKYESNSIPPISRRSTALKPVDENDLQGLHDLKIFKDAPAQEMKPHWVPEQVEDYFDAISPLNDQLVVAKGWWILELWPIKFRYQPRGSDVWAKKIGVNLGRYRVAQDKFPSLHWTVQQRMDIQGYKTQIVLDRKAAWNIVV